MTNIKNNNIVSKKIIVEGIVQGVGFRPFIYTIAKKNNLKGFVINKNGFVEILVIGKLNNIENFLNNLKENKPELSKINNLSIKSININISKYTDFTINNSNVDNNDNKNNNNNSTIPPDVAICEKCINEISNKNDRRYFYPFTSCTNCGPRFTVVKSLPYDRENTSMNKFPLCNLCSKEYNNPEDRRFYAQSTCCPKCGPTVYLTDKNGTILYENKEAIEKTTELLENGKIFGIKGIGGSHLVCDATNNKVVEKLRKRLNRPTQPFAIMTKENNLKLFANYDKNELNLLKSPKRPIVVLNKKNENNEYNNIISKFVSNLNTIGVMLPYSGIHHLLLKENSIFVMTSANLPGLPMAITNNEIINSLSNIADYYLLHNREIINRCDDSVIKKIIDNNNNNNSINNNSINNINNYDFVFLRRSRGYVPEPIIIVNNLNNKNNIILCLGAELNNTITLVKGNKYYISQHIGNTSKYETYLYLQNSINNILKITNTNYNSINYICCDLHPSFNTTKLAYELGNKYNIPIYKIQHHKAHCYSLLGDNNLFENSIIISIDGVGYGEDNTIWGGEIFYFNNNNDNNDNDTNNDNNVIRIGHLEPQIQCGGDLATKYPIRMLISILYKKIDKEQLINFIKNNYNSIISDKELKILLFQLDKNINVIKSSSTGRILDSIAVLLGVCNVKSYDGEPSIRLEKLAEDFLNNCSNKEYNLCVEKSKNISIENNILNTTKLVFNCYNMLLNNYSKEFIAYYIHLAIGEGLSKIAINYGKSKNITYIGLTGGASYNKIITNTIKENVEKEGFKFIFHKNIPNGDGGISFGQGVYLNYLKK